MNLKTQNKDSLEDSVSNSPDPSKQEKGLGKSLHGSEDKGGKEHVHIERHQEVVGKTPRSLLGFWQ